MFWTTLFGRNRLQRGYDYYLSNRVSIKYMGNNQIKAYVDGSEVYEVFLIVDLDKEKVSKMSCTCLDAKGNHRCKHMAATLYQYSEDVGLISKEDEDYDEYDDEWYDEYDDEWYDEYDEDYEVKDVVDDQEVLPLINNCDAQEMKVFLIKVLKDHRTIFNEFKQYYRKIHNLYDYDECLTQLYLSLRNKELLENYQEVIKLCDLSIKNKHQEHILHWIMMFYIQYQHSDKTLHSLKLIKKYQNEITLKTIFDVFKTHHYDRYSDLFEAMIQALKVDNQQFTILIKEWIDEIRNPLLIKTYLKLSNDSNNDKVAIIQKYNRYISDQLSFIKYFKDQKEIDLARVLIKDVKNVVVLFNLLKLFKSDPKTMKLIYKQLIEYNKSSLIEYLTSIKKYMNDTEFCQYANKIVNECINIDQVIQIYLILKDYNRIKKLIMNVNEIQCFIDYFEDIIKLNQEDCIKVMIECCDAYLTKNKHQKSIENIVRVIKVMKKYDKKETKNFCDYLIHYYPTRSRLVHEVKWISQDLS